MCIRDRGHLSRPVWLSCPRIGPAIAARTLRHRGERLPAGPGCPGPRVEREPHRPAVPGCRAASGHIPPGSRARLVDAVLALPEVQDSQGLQATVPLGDAESLQRLRDRCEGMTTRPAGSSALCLLYTSDAADDLTRVDLGGR